MNPIKLYNIYVLLIEPNWIKPLCYKKINNQTVQFSPV